jgi:hypothetical protein
MASRTEVSGGRPMRSEKAMGMAGGLAPPHGLFPLARRLVGVFRTIWDRACTEETVKLIVPSPGPVFAAPFK